MDLGDEEENEAQETRRKELEEGIYKAVCDNNIEKLLEMVEKGADIDTIFEDYSGVSTKSLLHVCCEKGRIECAKVLLDLGACVNLRDSWGQNSLMCCMITQYQDIAQLLLDKDQTIVNHQDRYGKTPLHCAVESGSLDSVRLLLRYDVDVCRHTAEGVTAVMLAVTLRDDEDVTATMIQLMIDAGYDLEMKDFRSKRTALQMAVVAKNLRFVDLLVSSGADVNTLDVAFRTPLTNAVYHHARKPPGKTTCVVDATAMAIITSLTQAKCDLNMTLVEHCNPLIAAAIVDSAELTQFFLENGSNIDTQFHATGSTALTVSVSRHSVASFLTLLRWNCDLEPRTHIQKKRRDYYLNAFELAVFLGHMDMAEILVKVGCDLQHISYLKEILDEDCIPEGLNKNLGTLSWMRISANNPRSLVDSCVLIVRRQLHLSVTSKATVLPLPTKVRQFVAMSDILSPPD